MKTSSLTSFLSVAGAASLSMLPVGNTFGRTIATSKTPPAQAVGPVTNDTGTGSTTVATDPVGYTTTALPANSDSLISIPFTRPVEYTGPVASVSGSTITLSGTPGFTANQFVYAQGTQAKTYYAIIGPLLTPLANTVSVTNNSAAVTGSGFSAIVPGDELRVNGLAYNVASVTSDTALVLSRAYTGTTATGLSASYNHSPKEGSYYTVTANSTGALTVNLNGDSLSAVAVGTAVSLIPYWTLGTAFPASDANVSFTPSSSVFARGTQILIPDSISPGINLAPQVSYYYLNGIWCQAGDSSSVSYNDIVFAPTDYFIVRNASTATTFTPNGSVYMNRLSVPLATQVSTSQDNPVAINRPVNVTLNDLGLISSGAFTESASVFQRGDQLLTFDNTSIGINKASGASYYYYGGGWRQAGASTATDFGSTVIPLGTGIVIRKAVTNNSGTSFWQNTRTY